MQISLRLLICTLSHIHTGRQFIFSLWVRITELAGGNSSQLYRFNSVKIKYEKLGMKF